MDAYLMQKIFNTKDIEVFAREILGIKLHAGQIHWLKNSNRVINILKPANQWGKTAALAVDHIWHAVRKPQLDRFAPDFDTWFRMRYLTLNFGSTYEVAKGVSEAIEEMVNGRYLLPDGAFNKSMLKGWAIQEIWDMPKMPKIIWFNNSETLIRSYDGLGKAFKRLRLAMVSGDECGDIPELNLFVTGTLLPRVAFFEGSVKLVGTAQPKGVEYEEISESAEQSIEDDPQNSEYFIISYNSNPQMASVYQNEFMPVAHLKKIEGVADPQLRKQIIEGQYVDYGDKLYNWEEVAQIFQEDIPYDEASGWCEMPNKDDFLIMSVDMAAAKDETSISILRYNVRSLLADGSFLLFPHRLIFHKAWKGETIPLPVQYAIIREIFWKIKRISPARSKFLYDAGSLGGKNAGEAFKELSPIYAFPPKGRSYAEIKGEMFGVVKEVLGRNREFKFDEKGNKIEKNATWGGFRASPKLVQLRRQFEAASKDDDKLKNDQFTTVAMGLHFIERRTPKLVRTKAVSYE